MNQATIPIQKPAKDEERIELKVESPVPGQEHADSWFSLYMPRHLESEEIYDNIVKHLEFRRKCMNQGFDNLLELLQMTKATLLADLVAAKAENHEQAESGN